VIAVAAEMRAAACPTGLKKILGVAAGLIATGGYYFVLREALFPKKSTG
jgi:hypothetical protein